MTFLDFHSLSKLPFPAYSLRVIKQFFKISPKSNPNSRFKKKHAYSNTRIVKMYFLAFSALGDLLTSS